MVFAHMFGGTAGHIVMGLMVISCFGSLLGWQFTIANVFKDGLMVIRPKRDWMQVIATMPAIGAPLEVIF